MNLGARKGGRVQVGEERRDWGSKVRAMGGFRRSKEGGLEEWMKAE